MRTKVTFANTQGVPLVGVLSDCALRGKIVIMCHGFMSSKDSKTYIAIEEQLGAEGIASLRFDFSGRGESGGRFADTTVSGALDDLVAAVNYAKQKGYSDIGILGSSFGGLTSLGYISRYQGIKALALKSPAPDMKSLIDRKYPRFLFAIWKLLGFTFFSVRKGGKRMFRKMYFRFYQDLSLYNGHRIAEGIRIPTIIVHGTEDSVVDFSECQKLNKEIVGSTLVPIEGGGHNSLQFTKKNWEKMVGSIVHFFTLQL